MRQTLFRFPRGNSVGVEMDSEFHMLPVGKAEWLTPEDEIDHLDIAILGYGDMAMTGKEAALLLAQEGIHAAAINPRWAKPLDEELILQLAAKAGRIITVETIWRLVDSAAQCLSC